MVDYRTRRRRRLSSRTKRNSGFSFKNPFLLSKLSKYLIYAFIAGVIAIPVMFLWFSRDLPTPGTVVASKFNDSTRIYDREGQLLYSVYQDQNRTYTNLDEISKYLQEGTIAIEDKDFYENKGFSPIGYVRSGFNFLRGQRLAGASTITQQLVKNVLLSSERSLPRKVKELMLSIQVTNKFSKDEILEMYLNNIPYGGTAIGIEAASQTYFGKEAKDLDLAESAFLAGLPQSPSLYSPYTGDDYYIGRTEAVLNRMVADKYITKEESEKALKKISTHKFASPKESIKAAHFVMHVKDILTEQFGEQMTNVGGLQVTTTLDYDLQKDAEKVVKDEIESLEKYRVGNGAALISNPQNGEVLAMVGSKDYFDTENDGNFNAVFANRQPGSSMKPIIYAQAFKEGYTPSTMLMDVRTVFPGGGSADYVPVNYSGKFTGPVQLRFALGNSLNIPAVKALALSGVKDSMQLAYDMGIENWEPTIENINNVGLSLVLGGRETTLYDEVTAYGTFANKGEKKDLVTILKVTDNKGKVLFEHEDRDGKEVLSEEIAFLISHILLDNVARTAEFGAGSALNIPGRTVAVKTGTTDEKRDNWTIGYTPSRVVGVWVGNNDNTPMNPAIASGTTGASTIWNKLMKLTLKDTKSEEFSKPENVVAIQVDPLAGGLPRDGQPTRTEYFVKGTEPTTVSSIYQSKDGKDYWVFKEQDPVSSDGVNRWQQGIDAWIEQYHKGEERYNPPGEVKDAKDSAPQETSEADPADKFNED